MATYNVLQHIIEVCDANADVSHPELALKFVRDLASRALATPPAREPEPAPEFRCGNCENVVDDTGWNYCAYCGATADWVCVALTSAQGDAT